MLILAFEVFILLWYGEIKETNKVENDLLTFRDAIAQRLLRRPRSASLREIAIIEDDFWSRPDRRKQKRDKNNPSDLSSWNDTYNRFYKYLPQNKPVNLKYIQTIEVKSKIISGEICVCGSIAALLLGLDLLFK